MKKIFLILLSLNLLTLLGVRLSVAADDSSAQAVSKAVNVGNKICPVSNEKIDEKMKATYEYKGKIYNFCCEMCIEEFKKNPENYIKKIEEELKAQVKEKEKKEAMPEMPMATHEGHQH